MIINWQPMGRMWPAELSSQGRRQGLLFFFWTSFYFIWVSSLQSLFSQNSGLLINIGDSSLWGLASSCHALMLPRKSNYIHGTFIHTHKVTPTQILVHDTHIVTSTHIFSLAMQRGEKWRACCNHPCLRGSPAIYSSAASVSRSRDLWFCAWCSCTFHRQAERKPSGMKKRSKAWLHSQKVDEKNVVCTRCNAIMSPRGGLTSAAAANVANRRVECTLCVFPSGIISKIDNEFD